MLRNLISGLPTSYLIIQKLEGFISCLVTADEKFVIYKNFTSRRTVFEKNETPPSTSREGIQTRVQLELSKAALKEKRSILLKRGNVTFRLGNGGPHTAALRKVAECTVKPV